MSFYFAGWSSAQRVHVASGVPGSAKGPRHGRRLRLAVHEGRRHQRREGNEQDGQDAQAAQQIDGRTGVGMHCIPNQITVCALKSANSGLGSF